MIVGAWAPASADPATPGAAAEAPAPAKAPPPAATPAEASAGAGPETEASGAAREAEAPAGEAETEVFPPVEEGGGAPQATVETDSDGAMRLSSLKEGVEANTWWQRLLSFVGLLVMMVLAWVLGVNRKQIPFRVIGWGVGLQILFGLFILKTDVGKSIFASLNDVVSRLLDFTNDGSRFIFGKYLDMEFSFALNVLPTIIFFSSLMTVLYHLGIMQLVVKGFAWVMQRTMGTSGSETLSAAANIFVGQTEA
ncbi:MAG: hypothetical protein D6729_19775, partial [Deltaproteobacteria bacterium]